MAACSSRSFCSPCYYSADGRRRRADQGGDLQGAGDADPTGKRSEAGAADRARSQEADRIKGHDAAAHVFSSAGLQGADDCHAEQAGAEAVGEAGAER